MPENLNMNTVLLPINYLYLFSLKLLIDIVVHTKRYEAGKFEYLKTKNTLSGWTPTLKTCQRTSNWIYVWELIQNSITICTGQRINLFVTLVLKRQCHWTDMRNLHNIFMSYRQSEPKHRPPNYDKLFTIRPITNTVKETFYIYTNHKGRLVLTKACLILQEETQWKKYIPAKALKRCVSVWMGCESKTYYLTKYKFYLGTSHKKHERGLGYGVVTELTNDLKGKHRHIYSDNYFTSVKLLKDLLKDGIYSCETLRPFCRNLPAWGLQNCGIRQ